AGRRKVAAGWYEFLSLRSANGSLISAKSRLRRSREYLPSSPPANWNVGRRSVRRHLAGSATSSQPCSCPKPCRTGRGPRSRLVITALSGRESRKPGYLQPSTKVASVKNDHCPLPLILRT